MQQPGNQNPYFHQFYKPGYTSGGFYVEPTAPTEDKLHNFEDGKRYLELPVQNVEEAQGAWNRAINYFCYFLVFGAPIGFLAAMEYALPSNAFQGHAYANPRVPLIVISAALIVWSFSSLLNHLLNHPKVKNEHEEKILGKVQHKDILACLVIGSVLSFIGVSSVGPTKQLIGIGALLVFSFLIKIIVDRRTVIAFEYASAVERQASAQQSKNVPTILSNLGLTIAVLTPIVVLSIMDIGNGGIFHDHPLLNPSAGMKLTLFVSAMCSFFKLMESFNRGSYVPITSESMRSTTNRQSVATGVCLVGLTGTLLSSATPAIQVVSGVIGLLGFLAGMYFSNQHESATAAQCADVCSNNLRQYQAPQM